MRKLLALTLAVAMVLSLAAVSFAAVPAYLEIDPQAYEDDAVVVDKLTTAGYNDVVLFAVNMAGDAASTEQNAKFDAAKGMKATATWEGGKDLVESVSVVRRMNAGKLAPYVAVKVVDKDTTTSAEIYGSIAVTMSGFAKAPANKAVFINISYDSYAIGDDTLEKSNTIATFGDGKIFSEEEEWEINLYGGAGRFVVDTRGQGKILLSNSVDVSKRAEIEAMYPDANFYYLNGNGKSFNKTGMLYIAAPAGSVLYTVAADGITLAKSPVAYDETEEAFVVKTRTLGTYVIADKELDLTIAPVAPVTPEVVNPGTGANA